MKRLGWLSSLLAIFVIYGFARIDAYSGVEDTSRQIQVITPEPVADESPMEVNADRLEYDADRRVMTGIGNVVIQQGDDVLTADYVEFHSETHDAHARGNVRFERGDEFWTGEEMHYNFRTREGDFGDFRAFSDPYHIRAKDSKQTAEGEYELRNVTLTTCDEEDEREFVIRAREARITDGTTIHARHVVVYQYGVPIFYTPYYRKNMAQRTNIDIMPGYSSRMGAFLLTGYRYQITPHVRGNTQLDYRHKRGFGYGQNFRWRTPDDSARGDIRLYYADDKKPIRDEREAGIRDGLIDNDRYRLGLSHTQVLGERDMLMAELNYLSDPFVQEDFFEDEFHSAAQPENRVTLVRRGDQYTASLLLNMRLNDFYENVNRLPEASLDISRQQIGDSPLYYEGNHSAVYLERVFPKGADRDDFDTVRLDSLNRIYYPTRHFGFLNVTPNVGLRSTYYSRTRDTRTVTNVVETVTEDGETVEEEEITTVDRSGPANIRNIYELGVETSYKAFKVLTEERNYLGKGLRHIAEPYARYSYVPRPNMRPRDLFQFDGIDRLDKQHQILFGARNKLQTRRRDRVHDMIDLDTFTIFRIEPERDERDFANLFFDARLRLADWVRINFDGEYDWYETEIARFNTQMAFIREDRSTLALEYRFDRDRRQLLMGELSLFPEQKWSFHMHWRYDIDENDLEEHSYMVERRFNCTGVGIGIRERDDEVRVFGQVWLLAFPGSELQLGR